VSENRVLRRIFGPKREEVVGYWRRLHNEELHNLYISCNTIKLIKSRRMKWAGHVAHGTDYNCIQNFKWKPEGKRQLETPKHIREDNIRETGYGDMD
jgi:hypothetical protein